MEEKANEKANKSPWYLNPGAARCQVPGTRSRSETRGSALQPYGASSEILPRCLKVHPALQKEMSPGAGMNSSTVSTIYSRIYIKRCSWSQKHTYDVQTRAAVFSLARSGMESEINQWQGQYQLRCPIRMVRVLFCFFRFWQHLKLMEEFVHFTIL